ncbi:MAG: T9SS type A sorting domain-containing protein [bacterium]
MPYFRTNANNNIRYVDFSLFDFNCSTPVKIFDLDNQLSGKVENYFIDYDFDMNRTLIMNTFEKIEPYMGVTPDWVKETMAEYPGTTSCVSEINNEYYNSAVFDFRLSQNYPNPFNPSTTINYSLPESGYITIGIYNLSGQKIETLVDGFKQTGIYQIKWETKGLPSGIYFCTIKAGYFSESRKLVLHK